MAASSFESLGETECIMGHGGMLATLLVVHSRIPENGRATKKGDAVPGIVTNELVYGMNGMKTAYRSGLQPQGNNCSCREGEMIE